MPDNRDITERLEDPSYDGAIDLRQDAAKEIRALRYYVALLEDQRAKAETDLDKAQDHVSKQALDIVTLGQEVGRLREALKHYACNCAEGKCESSDVDSFTCGSRARAALAEKDGE